MNIQLIEGEFDAKDALEIISQMIQVKIKYHEKKIGNMQHEEDIKLREKKIKNLQNVLHDYRNEMSKSASKLKINSIISIN